LKKYLIKIKKEISCLAEKTNKLLNKRPKSQEDKVQVVAHKDKESLNKNIKLKSLNKDQVVVLVTKKIEILELQALLISQLPLIQQDIQGMILA
jgi:hypothetical protein